MEYEIIPLLREKWKGTVVPIRYTTDAYFDLELAESENAFTARMVKKQFDTPVTHTPEEYDFPDRLYQDHWEKAEAYGIISEESGELLACIELCPEEWSNRLMVTELWVADRFHRMGFGTRLMDLAKEKAREQGRRAIILETQSCNVRAIAFYRSQGFRLIGFDACCYANNDIARHEVRFNFGYYLNREADKGKLRFEELTHQNYADAKGIDRDDVPEAFADDCSTLMEYTDYGVAHHCIGHTFLVRTEGKCIATVLLGEAIPWETDPPRVKTQPFYRLLGFVVDRQYRGRGYGGRILEEAIRRIYSEFGERPIVLGCHRDNRKAARFYERHGFVKTAYWEGNDRYYIRG